jgi:hypothetical protein
MPGPLQPRSQELPTPRAVPCPVHQGKRRHPARVGIEPWTFGGIVEPLKVRLRAYGMTAWSTALPPQRVG